jgi:hypothetical protein
MVKTNGTPYRVVTGPEGLLPPAATIMGVPLPNEGEGLVEGGIVTEAEALEKAAIALLTRKNATLFPGPLVLWGWNDHTNEKAKYFFDVANEIPGIRIIPMPDYRPIYPKIDPEAVINPCHPNLTISHNKIEACVFIGVHCHYASITLKMIRAGTNCFTIALCAEAGHEDAMVSVPNFDIEKLVRFKDALIRVKKNGIKPLYEGKGIVATGWSQIAALKGEIPVKLEEELVEAGAGAFSNELETGLDDNAE